MKKYMFCFLLFAVTCFTCLGIGYYATRSQVRKEAPIPNATFETETVAPDQAVVNHAQVQPVAETESEEQFYLVAEEGYLLVFSQDQSTVCLYTHMPLVDFPTEEQSKLMAGIWFSNMMDIFNYLESYTS